MSGAGAVRYEVDGTVDPAALRPLLGQADWARGRAEAGLAAMLAGSLVHVVAWAQCRPVGFARAIGDGVYRAVIEDVVVDAVWRRRGVGHELVGRLVDRLAAVEEVRLVAGEERIAFYERLGFRRDALPHMRRP